MPNLDTATYGKSLITQHELIALPTFKDKKHPIAEWTGIKAPLDALPLWEIAPDADQPTGAWVLTTNWDPCEVLLDLDCDPADIEAAQKILGIPDPKVFQSSASGKRHVCVRTAYPINLRNTFTLKHEGRDLKGDIRHQGSRSGVMWHRSRAVGKDSHTPRLYQANDEKLFLNRSQWQQLTKEETQHLEKILGVQKRSSESNGGEEATINALQSLIRNNSKCYESFVEIDHANDFCFSMGQLLGGCVWNAQMANTETLSTAVWKILLDEYPIQSKNRMEAHEDSFNRGFTESCESHSKYLDDQDECRRLSLEFSFSKSPLVQKIEHATAELFDGGVRLVCDSIDGERDQFTFYTLHKTFMDQPPKALLSYDDLSHQKIRSCRVNGTDLSTARKILETVGGRLDVSASKTLNFLTVQGSILPDWKSWLIHERKVMEPSEDVLTDGSCQ
jgi:hypothetical protein